MKFLGLINRVIPEKVLYFGLILGVAGLLVVGLIYGDLTVTVGSVAALIAMFKYGIMEKFK